MADPNAKTVVPQGGVAPEALDTVAPRVALVREPLDGEDRRYAYKRLLGEGGMGEVRLCRDSRIGRDVAQKMMRPDVARLADSRDRFLREAQVQGQLEHPAVVPVYDLGLDGDSPFFTMKRVRGLDLNQVLDGIAEGKGDFLRRFTRRRLLSAFSQVCLAIDFAHSRGVLHRDLKPANVMLGDFGEVHVLDWGLARLQDQSELKSGSGSDVRAGATIAGDVMGTPGYMPPEQARGELNRLGPATDIYALGAILFELLTLQLMNPGNDSQERLALTVKGFEVRPGVRVPSRDIPPELDALVAKACALDPKDRFASARELSDALEKYLDGDRDLSRRKELAEAHVQTAKGLLDGASKNAPQTRAQVMQELTRALGLEPENSHALQLLAALLAEVPDTLPPEAEKEMSEALARGRGEVAKTASVRYLTWLLFMPLVAWMGVKSWPIAAITVLVLLASFGLAMRLRQSGQLGQSASIALLALSSVALGLVGFLFGPFVLVPALAATNTMFFASYLPKDNRHWAVLAGLFTVLVPYALERAGVVPASWTVSSEMISLLPRMAEFRPVATEVMLIIGTLAAIFTPSVLVGRLRDSLSEAEKRLFLHAWHVRQLAQGDWKTPSGRA